MGHLRAFGIWMTYFIDSSFDLMLDGMRKQRHTNNLVNRTTSLLLASFSLANLDICLLEMGSKESVIGCCSSLRSSCLYYGGEDSGQK